MKSNAGLLLSTGVALAFALGVPAAAASESRSYHLSIPSQDLGDALRQLAQTSRQQVIFTGDLVQGRRSPALEGQYTVDEALERMLQGTGLQVRRADHGVLVLVRAKDAAQGASPGESGAGQGPAAVSVGTDGDAEQIVVTGSRLRGNAPTSHVITIGEESIRRAGHKNMADVIRNIPQNFSGGQNPAVASSGGNPNNQDYTGASSINLRGIGPDGTLTLLNGRRLAYGSFNQSVDASAVPLAAVERIEILAEGASAIYGSDAVAGVANIILKRDFEGVAAGARHGIAADGGGEHQNYNIVGGTTWSKGGFLIGYDFEQNEPVFPHQRKYVSYIPRPRTILPYLRRHNILATTHVDVANNVEVAADALYNMRDSWTASRVATSSGLSERETATFVFSPRITVELKSGWDIIASGVIGGDKTHFRSRAFTVDPNPVQIADSYGCFCNSTMGSELTAEGALFRLPGGSARLALGAGYRKNSLSYRSSTTSTTYNSSLSSHYAFGEVGLPLVSPENAIPFVHRLLVVGAARHERYKHMGSVTTPKIGASFSPVAGVEIRGSWGKSFKAPTLEQSSTPIAAWLYDAQVYGGNSGQVIVLSGGNNELSPERATTWSTTITLSPVENGPEFSISYFEIRYKDRVLSPITVFSTALSNPQYRDFIAPEPTLAMQENAISLAEAGLGLNGPAAYNPTEVIAILDNRYVNVASQRIHGLDLNIADSFPFGSGTIGMEGSASYIHSAQRIYPEAPASRLAGTTFNPAKYRARMGVFWQHGGFVVSGYLNYTSGLDDVTSTPRRRLSTMTTGDFSVIYKHDYRSGLLSGMEISASIQNITNERPPLMSHQRPFVVNYDSTNHSALGRFVSVGIRKHW